MTIQATVLDVFEYILNLCSTHFLGVVDGKNRQKLQLLCNKEIDQEQLGQDQFCLPSFFANNFSVDFSDNTFFLLA